MWIWSHLSILLPLNFLFLKFEFILFILVHQIINSSQISNQKFKLLGSDLAFMCYFISLRNVCNFRLNLPVIGLHWWASHRLGWDVFTSAVYIIVPRTTLSRISQFRFLRAHVRKSSQSETRGLETYKHKTGKFCLFEELWETDKSPGLGFFSWFTVSSKVWCL